MDTKPYPDNPPQYQQYPSMQNASSPNSPPPPPITTPPPVMNTNVVLVPNMYKFGETPAHVRCTLCGAEIITQIVHRSGLLTYILCGAICLFGCWLGCQFIPFCIDSLKDVDHYCPNCNGLIGSFKKLN